MNSSLPFDPDAVREAFFRDGYAVVTDVLSPDDVAQACELTDLLIERGQIRKGVGALIIDGAAKEPFFAELRERQPALALARTILGESIVHCGHTIIKCLKGQAHSRWHLDDFLECPSENGQPWTPPAGRMPVFWLSMQIALSDITGPEHGPTEVVPGSQCSGQLPPYNMSDTPDGAELPVFLGRGPEQIYCNAGDAYLFHHQVWHHGTTNQSERPRYLLQQQYGNEKMYYRFRWGTPVADSA